MLKFLRDQVKKAFGQESSKPELSRREPDTSAATLPLIQPPRVRPNQQSIASYVTRSSTSSGEQRLTEADRRVANTDNLTYRLGVNTKAVIRDLAAVSPDLSASVHAYTRMVVTRNFNAIARNEDGSANAEATKALHQLINRFNYLGDYTDGFSGMKSIHSTAESLVKELRLYGSCAGELVLDRARLPARIQGISTTQLTYADDGSRYIYPIQILNGEEINLDIPTFFVEQLDQDLLEAYSSSPMEAAVQSTLMDAEFQNDIRRVIKRALHPRLTATISFELFKRNAPADVLGDPDKLKAYQDQFLAAIESNVNGLEPEDALVAFDLIKFDYLNNGNTSLDREYETLQKMIDSKVSSATKSPGAVLGHASGSQNVASTETLLFAKYCEGIQNKINSFFSRAFTLGVRLLGYDVYVEFSFERIDLRPEAELQGFKQMHQERILTQLSIGMITDEEACIALTGKLPPDGAPILSGTFFKTGATAPLGNPLSNTASGALEQTLTPTTPQAPKGPIRRVQ